MQFNHWMLTLHCLLIEFIPNVRSDIHFKWKNSLKLNSKQPAQNYLTWSFATSRQKFSDFVSMQNETLEKESDDDIVNCTCVINVITLLPCSPVFLRIVKHQCGWLVSNPEIHRISKKFFS